METPRTPRARVEIVSEISNWTPLEYSIVCILAYKRDVSVGKVYEYLQANPTIIISCENAVAFHHAFIIINNNAAYPAGTSRRDDWIKNFTREDKQLCKMQYKSWESSGRQLGHFFKEHMQMEQWFPGHAEERAGEKQATKE